MMYMKQRSYCSDIQQSSGNHAPKCLSFSILCAKSVIIHTSIACMPIKTGVGVNCNTIVTVQTSSKVVGIMRQNACPLAFCVQNLLSFTPQ